MSLPSTTKIRHRPSRFAGSVAVVTGSGRGIGFQVARLLLADGAQVVVIDSDAERLRRARSELTELRSNAVLAHKADVTKPAEVDEMVRAATEGFGHIDILVNIVGGSYGAAKMHLMDFDVREWHLTLDLNLTSAFLCSRAVVPHMRSHEKGAIVNVSSTAGVRGEPYLWSPPYCAAKAAVQGMTRQLALEYGRVGIRVNCVAQADVLSERTFEHFRGGWYFEDEEEAHKRAASYPVGRMADPVEVANVICFLASDEASYMTGETVLVTGGSYMA